MVSLFFRQNGMNRRGEAIPCHLPALRRSGPAASKVHSCITEKCDWVT